MKRKLEIGSYCPKCEYVMPRHIKGCRCTVHLTETATAIHRQMHWVPAFAELSVTMESANGWDKYGARNDR